LGFVAVVVFTDAGCWMLVVALSLSLCFVVVVVVVVAVVCYLSFPVASSFVFLFPLTGSRLALGL